MPNAAPRWHSGSSHNCLGRPGTWLTPVWLRCWGHSFLPAHMGHLLRRTAWTPLGPAERYWGNLASYCLGSRCFRTTALGRSWSVNLIPDSHKMLPVSYRKICTVLHLWTHDACVSRAVLTHNDKHTVGARETPVVKRTGCSYRGHGISSHHPYSSWQPPETPVPVDLMLSSGLCGH